jgi:hypothetical protein
VTSAFEALRRPIADPITGGSFSDEELAVILEDLDVGKLILDLAHFKEGEMNIRESVLSADCELSLDGAHQVEIVVHDHDRKLYNSGILQRAVDIEIKGWWWRLARRSKSGDDITLTFEPRVVAWMRSETGRKKARRGKVTRAEFIRGLVRAISKGHPKFVAPELHEKQDKEKALQDDKPKTRDEAKKRKDRAPGFPKGYRIPSIDHPGEKFSAEQTRNAERVLTVGASMGARRKVLLMAMMTVYQESRFLTSATNHYGAGHVGLFQQDPRYWPATRIPEVDAKPFFKKLIAADKANPNGPFNVVIQAVQGGGPGEQTWATWRNQAEDIVSHFTGTGIGSWSTSVTVNKPYEFRVGKKEHYYGAAMRLADEVNWRFWTVRNTFHYQSEDSLFKSKPLMTLKEGRDGVDNFDFDDDDRGPVLEVTVTCRMRMWLAPVGTVVMIDDGGPIDGRYLVHTINRSYFSQFGTITLRKPTEPKPEPANDTKTITLSGSRTVDLVTVDDFGERTPKGIIDTYVLPIGRKHGLSSATGAPLTPANVAAANAAHGSTTSGSRSDHQGPPSYAWAVDMSNGWMTRDERAVAEELAKMFNVPWSWDGSRIASDTRGGFRFQLIFGLDLGISGGGEHRNHVHFGVKKL